MKTKTFNIGECSYYGTWNIKISDKIIITGMMYKTKEIKQVESFDKTSLNAIENFLTDISTPYYAGKMMEWIKAKV